MSIKEFFQPFFSFRILIVAGIAFGLWLFSRASESLPLSMLLYEKQVYLVPFLIVVGFHLLLWILVDKVSLYNIRAILWHIVRDTIVITAVFLSTVAARYLVATFL